MIDTLETARAAAITVRVVKRLRDDAIRAAVAEGMTPQSVADAVGLSRAGVVKIATQADTKETQ